MGTLLIPFIGSGETWAARKAIVAPAIETKNLWQN
jgi:hypothetical protein